jgi:tRNA G18 (ribose-2'-O)-methylase SpoU
MYNNVNERIQAIMALKQQGKDPNQLIQMAIQRNPQVQVAMQRLNNMAQGKNPQEFIMQLARQNGVTEQNIQALSQMFLK